VSEVPLYECTGVHEPHDREEGEAEADLRGGGNHTVDYRGTSLIRNRPPPEDHHRARCIRLL